MRVALVTGASRGIGRACARALAAAGDHVAVGWASDEEAATKAVAEIRADGGEADAVRVDVTDDDGVAAAFTEIEQRMGSVAVLVNNAGVTNDGLLLRMSDDQWHRVVRTSLDGSFHTIRRALPAMVRARHGRIVNVGSVAGLGGSAGQANYAAAKAGLVGLSRSVAREVGSRGITCNVVAPGPIATDMTGALPEDRRKALTALVPAGRFGTPEEVAAVVTFLCSDAASYVSGAVVNVDGGFGS